MGDIDFMGNTVFSNAQIDKRVVGWIRQKYSEDGEFKLLRLGSSPEIEEYNIYVESCRTRGNQMRSDNDLLKSVIGYENALSRLSQYRLSEGRPEQVIETKIGEQLNPETGEIEPIYSERIIPAIDPLPSTIAMPIYDDNGNIIGTENVPNPAIVNDEAGRNDAQELINITTDEVKNLAEGRLSE